MLCDVYVLELLRFVQLRFVTICHVTFTLCCFTLCNNIIFMTSHANNQSRFLCVSRRETSEGWPLLTVEIEVSGDSKSCFIGFCGTWDFCPALADLVGPVQNIFPPTVHYFNSHRTASWAGSPAGLPVS
jgi:hypothetical protein